MSQASTPREWCLTEDQEDLLLMFLSAPGEILTTKELMDEFYPDDEYETGTPAPAKLRVMIMRIRDLLTWLADEYDLPREPALNTKRGQGWTMPKKSAKMVRELL